MAAHQKELHGPLVGRGPSVEKHWSRDIAQLYKAYPYHAISLFLPVKNKLIFLQGDSGGPIFETNVEPILTGVISGTDPSCGTEVTWPSIVSSVGFFRDWIDSQLLI